MDYVNSIIIEEDAVSSTVEEEEVKDDVHVRLDRIEKKLDFLISFILKDGKNSEPRKTSTSTEKLASLQDLIEFEQSLNDGKFKSSLIDHVRDKFKNMSKYEDSIRKLAYDVIDTFTNRCLFKLFSMNGKSRNGEENLALRDHPTYINFIFQCILQLSPKYKYEWLENVFGVLCRNKNTAMKTETCKKVKLEII